MTIRSLQVTNVRRLHQVDLPEIDRANLVWGANGSGKTSLLEAIHLLGTGRSFRSRKAAEVIRYGQASLLVVGRVESGPGGAPRSVGIEKTPSSTRIRVDGESLKSASQLARLVPVLIQSSDSFGILDGGPALRRSFLDRTLFHVEPGYLMLVKRAYRALEHRNELLRTGALSRIAIWEQQFSSYAEEIHGQRSATVAELNRILAGFSTQNGIPDIALDYRRGWKADTALADLLERHRARDIQAGFTGEGPHRAEVRVLVDDRAAAAYVSRGQAKLVLSMLLAAHAELISQRARRYPVLLVDDLPSELDMGSLGKAVATLMTTGCQVFFTAVDPDPLLELIGGALRVFHVEQGNIRPTQRPIA